MRIDDEPAFVLHVRPWRETSLLIELLTLEHGRLGAVARGVQGPKRQLLRAALQPLQSIRFSAVARGDLAQLRSAEAIDLAPRLVGETMLAGFYINELLLRLVPRNDPLPELHMLYGEVRECLRNAEPLAWTLRRFERDLLEVLGFGFDLLHDADGHPLDPAARYRLDPLDGPQRVLSDRGAHDRNSAATGRGLLALGADTLPEVDDMPGLRRAMRAVLAHHLGARGLKSWEMMADLARSRSVQRSDQ